MQMRDDERRLADLFLQITKIPKEKFEKALTENNIRQIIVNPALLSPTVSQLSRIQTLQEFRSLYTTLDHFEKKYQICRPSDAAAYLRPTLADREYEIAVGLLLDTRNNVIKQLTLGEGTLDSAVTSTRKLAKGAILYNAKSVILAHNHPSGNSKPSRDDIETTKKFAESLAGLEIQIIDHIIIGDNSFVSMKELGVMPVASALSERHGKYRVKDNVFCMEPMEENPKGENPR